MSKTKELFEDIRDSERVTIPQLIREYGDEVLGGNVNEFDAFIYLREIKKTLDDLIDQIKDKAVEEAEKYKGQTYKGYRVDIQNLGGRYSYSHIPEYNDIVKNLKAIEFGAKEAYLMSQKGKMVMDELTGEVLPMAQYKAGTDTIKLTPVKQ
jgi:hypothetical protein